MLNLNDREWRDFSFEELFIVKRGDSVYKQYMKKGSIPYVSASAVNNGISDYCNSSNRGSNMISLAYDGSIGATFYQSTKWFASEKIVSIELKERELNREIALFLCRVISHQRHKYSYGYKWSVGIRMMRGKIMIPVNCHGEPDYDFMEAYIREREEFKRKQYIQYTTKRLEVLKNGGGGTN